MENNTNSIVKKILYVTIIAGFIGSSLPFLMISIGPFSLFPYRIFVILLWFIFLFKILLSKGIILVTHIKIDTYLKFLILWLFYAACSYLWAISKINAAIEIWFLFMGISIIFMVVNYLTSLASLKIFFNLWLFMIVLSVGYAIWQYIIGDIPMPNLVNLNFSNSTAPVSFYKFQNFFSIYLALSIPFILTFIRYTKSLLAKLFFIIILIVSIILLLLTVARSCYLALFSSLLFWYLFTTKSSTKGKSIVSFSFLVFIIFILFPSKVALNIISIIQDQILSLGTGVADSESSVNLRYNAIRNSFHFFWQSGGIGVGAGNAYYYLQHRSIYNVNNNPYIHNWWVEILTNYGIFIFFGYVFFYLKIFINLIKSYPKLLHKHEKMICESLLMGMVAFPLASMSNGTIIYFPPHWIFFAFLLGYLNYIKLNKIIK